MLRRLAPTPVGLCRLCPDSHRKRSHAHLEPFHAHLAVEMRRATRIRAICA